MSIEGLILHLNSLSPIGPALASAIRERLVMERFRKGHILSSPGRQSHAIWYIVSGLAKEYYYDADGKMVVTAFWLENELVVDADRFFGKKRTDKYIELIEDCQLMTLNVKQAHELQTLFPEVQPLGYSILSAAKRKDNERSELIMLNAKECFKRFSRNFPMERISVTEAAAYLGLSRQTLSMIRASDARNLNTKKNR